MFYDTDTKRVDFALSDKNILYYNNGKKIEIFREQINEKYCEIKKSHRKKMQYDKYFYKIFCEKLNYTLKINKEILINTEMQFSLLMLHAIWLICIVPVIL